MKQKYEIGQKSILELPIEVKKVDKEKFTLTMIASVQSEDRHGDILVQSGVILDNYLKNPVILNSHNYYDATEVIARATRTEVIGKGKRARIEQDWLFAVNENPKAKIIFDLYAGGFLHASSVGFLVRAFAKDDKGNTDYFTITEWELLEVSAVSVPAQAQALAKQKGIDVDVLIEKKVKSLSSDHGIVCMYCLADISEEEKQFELPTETQNVVELVCESCYEERTKQEDTDNDEEDTQADEDAEDEATSTDEDADDAEDVEDPMQEQKTIVTQNQRIIRALGIIAEGRKERMKRAARIINDLIAEKEAKLDEQIAQKVRNRKLNQAIRELMRAK